MGRKQAAAAAKAAPEVAVLTQLPLDDPPAASARIRAFAGVGATRLVHAWRYADAGELARAAESLGSLGSLTIGARKPEIA